MIDDKAPEVAIDPEFSMAPNSLGIALRAFREDLLRQLPICFPCCIYSFDRTTHIARVMPLVKQAFYSNEWVYLRRQTFDVTVRNIQAGGFTIDFPLFIGDTGWVFSSDRDTLLLKREGALTNSVLEGDRQIALVEDSYQTKPNTPQLHKQIFGFFLPDNWGKWETNRFKDNPAVSIGNALYIGSSIDTEDEDEVGGQKGDAYEKKTTSSVVLQKGGGAYVLSSTRIKPDDVDDRCRTSKVSVVGDTVEIAVSDMTEEHPIDASVTIGTESGIVIRQDNPKDNLSFIASVQEDQFTMRLMDIENKKTVSMSFENGQLDIHTSDAVNIFSQKDVNIKGAEHAYVSSKEARVVAEETASVSAKTVSASAEETVNIAAGKDINLTAPDNANIITASTVTVMAKEPGAEINVQALSKESVISIEAQGNESLISLEAIGNNSMIDIDAPASGSTVSASAANGTVSVTGQSIQIEGNTVAINGDIFLNKLPILPGRDDITGGPHWTYM